MIEFKLKATTFNENWWDSSKNKIAKVLEEENQKSWEGEREPNTGAKWAPRKQPTGTWPILRKSGSMFDKTKIKPSGGVGLFSAKTVSYGPFHQYGTSKMVARPWLGVPDGSLRPIADIIANSILRGRR